MAFVILKKHWRGYRPGKVFADMPDGAAAVLIRRGFAASGDERTSEGRPAVAGRKPSSRRPAVKSCAD